MFLTSDLFLTKSARRRNRLSDAIILALFSNNEQGAYYDPYDLTDEKLDWVAANPSFTSAQFMAQFPNHTLFQDSLGTIPVTGNMQPVGRVLDKRFGGVRGENLRSDLFLIDLGETPSFTPNLNTATGEFNIKRVDVSNQNIIRTTSPSLSIPLEFIVEIINTGGEINIRTSGGSNRPIALSVGLNRCVIYPVGTLGIDIQMLSNNTEATGIIHSIRPILGNHGSQPNSAFRMLWQNNNGIKTFYRDGLDDALNVTLPAATYTRIVANTGTGYATNTVVHGGGVLNILGSGAGNSAGYILIDRVLTPTEMQDIYLFMQKRIGGSIYKMIYPQIIESFNSLNGFTAPINDGLLTLVDNSDKTLSFGTHRLSLTRSNDGGSSSRTDKLDIGEYQPDLGLMSFIVHRSDDADANTAGTEVRLSQTSSFPFTPADVYDSLVSSAADPIPSTGSAIRVIKMDDSYWAGTRGFVAGEQMRVRLLSGTAPSNQEFSNQSDNIDGMLVKVKGRPTIILTYDDANSGVWDELSYTDNLGIRGTIFLPWERTDEATTVSGISPSILRLNQVQDLKASDWDIQLDGTPRSQSMITGFYTDTNNAIQILNEGRSYLSSNGLNSYAEHFCYPNGDYTFSSPTYLRNNVDRSIGSPILTMASTADIAVGFRAVGFGIPLHTRVLSVDSSTQVTLDANCTANISNSSFRYVKFVDDSNPFHKDKLQKALKSNGFLSGRLARNGGWNFTRWGMGDYGSYYMQAINGAPGTLTDQEGLDRVLAYIDEVIQYGVTGGIYYHHIVDGNGGLTNVNRAVYRQVMTYLASKVSSGELDVLTVDEWYTRDCLNPRPYGA